MSTMTLEQKVARLKLVADGLRRIQEFESARYLDEYAAHLAQPAQAVDVPDAQLCAFYQVKSYPELVREMEGHIAKLQAKLKGKRPWEQTFPPTPRA